MSKKRTKHPSPGEGLGGLPRSTLPQARHHIYGWPREHYTADHREKHQYKSEESARRAAHNRTLVYGEPFDAYQCQYCGCWHIGHRRMLPVEQEVMLLKQTIEGELTMINRYKQDLNQMAQSQLALFEKLEHLEQTVQNHYRELYLMEYNNKHPETK